MDANVFYHHLEALTSIHVCWFSKSYRGKVGEVLADNHP